MKLVENENNVDDATWQDGDQDSNGNNSAADSAQYEAMLYPMESKSIFLPADEAEA